MKKINKNNPYGYKVGYYENGSRLFIRYFKTYTYSQAINAKRAFETMAIHSREDNHLLVKPVWEIKPISLSEYAKGIWREAPF